MYRFHCMQSTVTFTDIHVLWQDTGLETPETEQPCWTGMCGEPSQFKLKTQLKQANKQANKHKTVFFCELEITINLVAT